MKLDMRTILLYVCMLLVIGIIILIGYSIKKCDCAAEIVKTDDEILSEKYTELNNKLIEYMNDIYISDEWMNGGLDLGVHNVTLGELESKGYDISMFVNPITGEDCNKDYTYGRFIILGTKEDGKTDYTYTTAVACDKILNED